MNVYRWTTLFTLSLLTVTMARAQSDTPIVYCARYYSQKSASHFHLYRINPDGTGRHQITFGNTDDYLPAWSPDGKYIVFWRGKTLWLIDANGKNPHAFYTTATDDFYPRRWASDSKGIIVTDPDGKAVLVSLATGKATPYPTPAPEKEVEVLKTPTGVAFPKQLPDGTQKQVTLIFSPALKKKIATGDLEADYWRVGPQLPNNGPLTLWQSTGDSTSGHWFIFYRVDETTHTLSFLTEGNTLSWSPKATQFVTILGRDLAPLSKTDKRTVWVSQLFVGTLTKDGSATRKPIVSGLVDAGGSDWRGGQRTIIP